MAAVTATTPEVDAMPDTPGGSRVSRAGAPTRVLLVEDHAMVAEALTAAFAAYPEIELVGCAHSLAEAIPATARERPDVVLLDRRLPDGDGIDAIPVLRAESPGTRVLVFTGDANSAMAARILEARGAGLLLKSGLLGSLVESIRTVAGGEIVVQPELLADALAELAGNSGAPVLTARERQVLTRVAEGKGIDHIAGELELARNTVRNHVQRILTKTGTHSKLEAVAVARRAGLIE
ncbi:response regulator transcription factor [Amycolatopsis samaneae]|uniref:Response regulator transcription factor n=1 Tax=Amycolatopsis samaneae TaxID=664691 RepID=A0ABW5GDZ8_9PSEU